MKEKKLQVFVSSTFLDLREERQAAVEAILMAGHIPAGMELFASEDRTQWEVIKKWIDDSDVYLLILGGRYGSIDKESGKSYTHLEYEYAIEKGKAFFAVVVTDDAQEGRIKEHGSKVTEQEYPQKLKEFKALVRSKMVKQWDDLKDIKLSIVQTLSIFASREELVGWVRADQAVNVGFIAEEMAELSNENKGLRARVAAFELNGSSEPKFVGLSFEQMVNHLEKIRIWDGGQGPEGEMTTISVIEYLESSGPTFTKEVILDEASPDDQIASDFLSKFGLVRVWMHEGWTMATFTSDGHRFYLQLISKAN